MIALLLKKILWVDCLGALGTGMLILSLSGWLSSLYSIPFVWIIGHGLVHLTYGTYSLSLALRRVRPLALILLLVFANAVWAVICFSLAIILYGCASSLAVGHFVFEGMFVGALAAIEWTRRHQLSAR